MISDFFVAFFSASVNGEPLAISIHLVASALAPFVILSIDFVLAIGGVMSEKIERHTMSVLVENEPGVLARVIGLFAGRGYNIESLTVAEVDVVENLSRVNLVTTGPPMIIEQIKNQLDRLVPVRTVSDLTAEGSYVERELALIKVVSIGEKRVESLRIADIFRAHVVDSENDSFVFEMTGKPSKIDAFVRLMEPLGLTEISRTGVSAMLRGKRSL